MAGCIRSLGTVAWEERRAYERRYYHEKAKAHRSAYAKANYERFKPRIRAAEKARYWRDPERFRSAARVRMAIVHARRRAL